MDGSPESPIGFASKLAEFDDRIQALESHAARIAQAETVIRFG